MVALRVVHNSDVRQPWHNNKVNTMLNWVLISPLRHHKEFVHDVPSYVPKSEDIKGVLHISWNSISGCTNTN